MSVSDASVSPSVLYLYLLRVTLYDYQALCWVFSESSDSGHTLLDVSTALFTLCSTSLHTRCKVGIVYSMFVSNQYFLFIFLSLALLCFLLHRKVDPDWACHVRLLCMSKCLLSVILCALRTYSIWGPLLLMSVCGKIYILYDCLRVPSHARWRAHQWSWAVMATWCFL